MFLEKKCVCVFITKCYVVNDDDDEKEARVVFSNDTVLQMLDSVMIFRIDARGPTHRIRNGKQIIKFR